MTALDTRDTSTIGAAIGRVVDRHVQVRPKQGTAHLPSYWQPKAVETLVSELRAAGFEIVRAGQT